MRKNIYLSFMITILTIAVVLSAILITTAIDRMRSRAEDSLAKIAKMENKLDELNRKINNGVSVSRDKIEQKDNTSFANIANKEFFAKTAKYGNKLIGTIQSETQNMNNIINNESLVGSLWGYTNDSIAERNYANPAKFEPLLAESWSISDDKLSYIIKLRKGVLWHDFTDPVSGKEWKNVEVTAKDFKFYVSVIKNKDVDCAPIRGYFQALEKIEIINDYEFKVIWNKKYFLSESMTLGLSPLPKHFYYDYEGKFDGKKFNDDHERNRIIVGCGSYQFLKWEKGQRIILSKWDKYYGNKLGIEPPLSEMIFEVIKHPNTQLQALKSKDIDKMGFTQEQWINKTDSKEFKGQGAFIDKFKYTSKSYSYIGWNQQKEIFQDKKVRRALTHLVNRPKILKDVYYNLARIVTGNFFIDSVYNDKSIKPYEFNIEKAKELLKEAGWEDSDGDMILDKAGKKFEFKILAVSNHPIHQKMLPIIKEDMAKAGIIMNIQRLEWPVYVQRLNEKKFDACTLGWGMGFESDPHQIWHSSHADKKSSSNHVSFKNKKADELIDKIRVEFDLKKRTELCHQFHQLLHEEQPYTFLFSAYSLEGINKSLKNTKVFPIGIPSKIMYKEFK